MEFSLESYIPRNLTLFSRDENISLISVYSVRARAHLSFTPASFSERLSIRHRVPTYVAKQDIITGATGVIGSLHRFSLHGILQPFGVVEAAIALQCDLQ